MKYKIYTPYGNCFIIHGNGNIERTDIKGFKPSGQWRFVALVRTNGFTFGKLANVTLSDLASGKVATTYKNGRPRYTVIDYDHGSNRIWANTKVHGVKRVEVLA